LDEQEEDGVKEHGRTSLSNAFSQLESSMVGPFLQTGSAREVLGRIAALNAEVGKAALSSPELLSRLKVLQVGINDVTRAVKNGDENDAKIALAEARAVLEELFP
jgi:hypothetical protein